jgi:hypothetical protein
MKVYTIIELLKIRNYLISMLSRFHTGGCISPQNAKYKDKLEEVEKEIDKTLGL